MQAAVPLMVAGSLIQGVGGFRSGQASAAAARENARQAELEGAAQADQIRRDARMQMGQQIGAQAESGFLPGTGTALDSLRESGINAEMDVLNARRKAAATAAQQRQAASQAKMEGLSALVGGVTNAAGAIYGAHQAKAQMSAQYPSVGGAASVVSAPPSFSFNYGQPFKVSPWSHGTYVGYQ